MAAHAVAALGAMGLGAVQFLLPKGTISHRMIGRVWVTLMAIVAVASLWIHEFRMIGAFSAIHLLSLLTLAVLVHAIRAARQRRIRAHRNAMIQPYLLAVILTGLFTLLPGRTMHAVLFGP
ncbi:DUF2306 domain-containing protein [Roseovarius sp. SYSU LYC5161]|uniref:DUF2306 domain-containing protein n=1 Tax=Roseovarius halophilus (ex Wu et al. 2025) TaxID=3376060 RepID=UPI003999A184